MEFTVHGPFLHEFAAINSYGLRYFDVFKPQTFQGKGLGFILGIRKEYGSFITHFGVFTVLGDPQTVNTYK